MKSVALIALLGVSQAAITSSGYIVKPITMEEGKERMPQIVTATYDFKADWWCGDYFNYESVAVPVYDADERNDYIVGQDTFWWGPKTTAFVQTKLHLEFFEFFWRTIEIKYSLTNIMPFTLRLKWPTTFNMGHPDDTTHTDYCIGATRNVAFKTLSYKVIDNIKDFSAEILEKVMNEEEIMLEWFYNEDFEVEDPMGSMTLEANAGDATPFANDKGWLGAHEWFNECF